MPVVTAAAVGIVAPGLPAIASIAVAAAIATLRESANSHDEAQGTEQGRKDACNTAERTDDRNILRLQ